MAIYGVNRYDDVELGYYGESTYEGLEGALAIVAESEQNYNRIMQAVGISELNYLEATGEEIVYEAGRIEGFFDKVKEFFKKLMDKLKSLYANFIAWLDSYVKQSDDFAKKYGPILTRKQGAGELADFEFTGFNFTNLDNVESGLFTDGSKEFNGVKESVEFIVKKFSKESIEGDIDMPTGQSAEGVAVTKKGSIFSDHEMKKVEQFTADDYADDLRGEMLGGKGPIEAGDFSKELTEWFRDGETKGTHDYDGRDVVKAIESIKGSKKNIDKAKKYLKTTNDAINKVIKVLEGAEKQLLNASKRSDKATKYMNSLSKCISGYKTMMELNVTYNGAVVSALKDKCRQEKTMCVKAMSYRTDSKKREEKLFGEGFTHFTEGFLDNVILK